MKRNKKDSSILIIYLLDLVSRFVSSTVSKKRLLDSVTDKQPVTESNRLYRSGYKPIANAVYKARLTLVFSRPTLPLLRYLRMMRSISLSNLSDHS